MDNLNVDNGTREYDVNGRGILRFNPSDPEMYERFLAAIETVRGMEKEYTENAAKFAKGGGNGEAVIHLMHEFDVKIKRTLSEAFGEENDFNKLLGGVSMFAVTPTGRVITNLLNALTPIFEAGINEHLEGAADEAVSAAKLNREQRRAAEKK